MEAVELDPTFWRGRRVLVTGHTGFKGAWLLVMLRRLGADVTGFALEPPTSPSLFDLLDLSHSCRHRIGDVRDLSAVNAVVQDSDPEVVLHMAAQPLVRASYATPIETYAVNVMGTVHVLDACRRAPNLRAVVAVTTDKCYENEGWVWGYRESDRLGGADPYSNSKACSELAVDAYRRSFFTPRPDAARVASARAGNVIGGGDFAEDRLVPDAARAFGAGKPLMIRNPLAVRPWQHVVEPLYGYLLLAQRLYGDATLGRGWNFGPRAEESASVGVIADRLVELWGEGADWQQDPADHPHEAATLKLDSTQARLELGWAPRLTLDAAVMLTGEWYRAHHNGEDISALTERHVADYIG